MAESGKSITWIVVAAAIFVLLFGWGFLAGSYAGAHTTSVSELSHEKLQSIDPALLRRADRGAISSFIGNSIEELPNVGAVISWHLTHRIWLPILIALALIGVLAGGVVLHKLEQKLSRPRKKRW